MLEPATHRGEPYAGGEKKTIPIRRGGAATDAGKPGCACRLARGVLGSGQVGVAEAWARQLLTRGVGDDVRPQAERQCSAWRVTLVRLPPTRQVFRAVNQHRLAAHLDALQLDQPRSKGEVRLPYRMLRRQSLQGVTGPELLAQGVEALVERLAAAARLHQQEAAPFHVLLEQFLLLRREAILRRFMAVEVDDGRFQQIGRDLAFVLFGEPLGLPSRNRAEQIQSLPGHRRALEQLLAGEINEVATVVAIVVPVGVGPSRNAVGQLADQDRRAPLGEKEEGKTRADNRPGVPGAGFAPVPTPLRIAKGVSSAPLFLRNVRQFTQDLAALAIPIARVEETLPRQPPRPLDAVDVVKGPLRHVEAEMQRRTDPAEGMLHCLVILVVAAVGSGAVGE